MLPPLPGLSDNFASATPVGSQPAPKLTPSPTPSATGPFSTAVIKAPPAIVSPPDKIPPIDALAHSIASVESHGDYGAVSPINTNGNRAYGKYQVLASNIPSWTKATLGYAMDPQSFLKDAGAQEKVVRQQLQNLWNKYGNVQDVASVWFSGHPAKGNVKQDITGVSVPQYVSKVSQHFNSLTGGTSVQNPPSQSSEQFSKKESFQSDTNPITFLRSIGQGIAGIGGSLALTRNAIVNKENQVLGNTNQPTLPTTLAVDPTAPEWEQNLHKAIFGDEPVKDYSTRIAEAIPTAQRLVGTNKGFPGKVTAPFLAAAGVLGGDAINFLGGEGEAESIISTLAKETDAAKVADVLVSKGIARDIAETYAPEIAKVKDPKMIEDALGKATDLQISKHTAEAPLIGEQGVKSSAEMASPTLKESFDEGVRNRATYAPVQTDAESQARAFASSIEGDLSKKGYGGFGTDLKNGFESWVNERRTANVAGFFKAQEFKTLDTEGLDGIFKFQEGGQTGKLAELKQFFDEKYQLLKDTNIDLHYKKDYLPQLWNNTPEQIGEVTRRLGLNPSFTMESVIENYKKGIEAGLTPKYTKLSQLAGWYEQRASKAIADRKFFDFLASNNFIQPATKAPFGWKSLDPDLFPLSRVAYAGKEYTGVLKAPPDLANVVNNYLRTPDGPIAKFAGFASTVKNIVLSSGIPETGLNAHGLNILARNTLSANNPIGGFLKGTYYLLNPGAAEKWLIENSKNATFFASHGLTLSTEDHALDEMTGNFVSKGYQKLLSFQQKHFEMPLFQKVIPALKVERANVIFQDLVKHYPQEEAAKLASSITNNIFGGINWEAYGRSRETQNLLRSFLLAPDWAESNIKLGKNLAQSVFQPNNPAGKAYRLMIRNLFMAYTAANVTNYASSGHWMWENDAGLTFEIAACKTADGQTRYIRPFGTAADFVRIPYDVALSLAKGDLSSIGRVIRNRLSAPVSAGVGAVFNVDPFGQPLFGKDKYNRDIPVGKQIGNALSLGGNLGIPQYGQALINLATGRYGVEQSFNQGLETPFRYVSPPRPKGGNLGGLPGGGLNTSLPGMGKSGLPALPGL